MPRPPSAVSEGVGCLLRSVVQDLDLCYQTWLIPSLTGETGEEGYGDAQGLGVPTLQGSGWWGWAGLDW